MGHITAELTKGWMMEGIGMQVILRILLSLALAAIIGCERLQQASFRRYEDFYAGQCICYSSRAHRSVSVQ